MDIFFEAEVRSFWSFKKFKAIVEKENGHQIKAMKFDQEGEFTSKELVKVLWSKWNPVPFNSSKISLTKQCCRKEEHNHFKHGKEYAQE